MSLGCFFKTFFLFLFLIRVPGAAFSLPDSQNVLVQRGTLIVKKVRKSENVQWLISTHPTYQSNYCTFVSKCILNFWHFSFDISLYRLQSKNIFFISIKRYARYFCSIQLNYFYTRQDKHFGHEHLVIRLKLINFIAK